MKGLASLLTLSLYYWVLKKGCPVLAIQGKLAKVTIQVLVFGITFCEGYNYNHNYNSFSLEINFCLN